MFPWTRQRRIGYFFYHWGYNCFWSISTGILKRFSWILVSIQFFFSKNVDLVLGRGTNSWNIFLFHAIGV